MAVWQDGIYRYGIMEMPSPGFHHCPTDTKMHLSAGCILVFSVLGTDFSIFILTYGYLR
jgi:hypothetical protein